MPAASPSQVYREFMVERRAKDEAKEKAERDAQIAAMLAEQTQKRTAAPGTAGDELNALWRSPASPPLPAQFRVGSSGRRRNGE